MASLVLDVEGADPDRVRRSVASVTGQTVGGWELLLHGAGAAAAAVAAADPRVRAVAGAETLETDGDFVAFLRAGDALASPEVLELVAELAGEEPDVDVWYGDERVGDAEVAGPLWSPERLLGTAWLDGPVFLRTDLVRRAWDDGGRAPRGRELVLRVTAAARRVDRVPGVLFERLDRGTADHDDVLVVREHLRRQGIAAEVVAGPVEGSLRVRRTLPEGLSVSVVVPTAGRRGVVRGERRWLSLEAVRSVLAAADGLDVEVVVVPTEATEPSLLDALLALGDAVRLVPFREPLSRPSMVALGVVSSASDVVVLADERLEVRPDGFLPELLGPLTDAGVGMTGPRVLDPRGRLVDAGLAFRRRRVEPVLAGRFPDDPELATLLATNRETSGLGGACLALRRSTFELAGGLNPGLARGSHVDLAFKLRHLGLRRVWVPGATADLSGHGSTDLPLPEAETALLRDRWLAPDTDEYAAPEPG